MNALDQGSSEYRVYRVRRERFAIDGSGPLSRRATGKIGQVMDPQMGGNFSQVRDWRRRISP